MTISRSNIPKQITTGGRKMKKKGYRAGGAISPRKMMAKGMKMGGKVKTKGMKKGGKVMTLAAIRTAAKKKGYKLVKA
jgi:hypothetical protein